MLEAEVIDQLSRYGEWVERHEGVELRPKSGDLIGEQMETTTGQSEVIEHRNSPRVLIAAVVAIVGLVGVAWAANQSGSSSTAFLAADPPGALFVLPDEAMEYSLTNGSVEVFTVTDVPEEVVIFGSSDQGVFRELQSASLTTAKPLVPPRAEWIDVETAVGVAQQSSFDIWTRVTLQLSDWWITVTTGPDRLAEAIRVLEGVTVTTQGSIRVSEDLTGEVIERVTPTSGSDQTSTYADATSKASKGQSIAVETATAPTPLNPVAVIGGELSEAEVQGLPAWRITRDDGAGEGEWNGLAWLASPNRIVAVSGHAPIAEIRLLAESLRPVEEDRWRAATGAEAD